MRTFKRVLAVIVIVISVAFILVNIAGLAGVWWTEATAVGIVTDVVRFSDTLLQRTQVGVDRLNSRVGEVQVGVKNLEAQIRQTGDKVTDTNLVFATLQAATDKDITPAVERLQSTTESLNDTLDDLDRTLRMLDRLTSGDNRINNTVDRLRGVLTVVRDVQQDVQDYRQALQQKKEDTVSTVVDRVTQPVQRLDNRLTTVQERLANTSAEITDGRARLERIHSTVNLALFLLALALTFVILWGILALIALILYSVSFLTGRDPIARWYASAPTA